jgi:hypothetical protein
MTIVPPEPPASAAAPAHGLVLRPSTELGALPAPAPASATPLAADSLPSLAGIPPAWLIAGFALLASAGWLLERRRRRRLETEKDSILWADVQPPASSIITTSPDDETEPVGLPPVPVPHRPPAFGESASHREATLIDLHQLDGRLRRRRTRGDLLGAVSLLQQHLADFRYTSPWVFLELRELHHLLGREQEWELAREAFRARFSQKAPLWQAPSTADAQLADDAQICSELVPEWPYREARMVVLHWMLGAPENRQQDFRPPILALGVYRDLLFIDRVLDPIMLTHPPPTDSLL